MGLVYNPIHNRKDNNGNNNEINDDTSRVYNCNARYNNSSTFRTSHVRFNDKLCWCCVYVWGVAG